ncbi:hypothetical protein VF21_10332, partial [Pseudogymnoascus sp. 05NY08]
MVLAGPNQYSTSYAEDCTICTTCGQQMSQDGKCQVRARLRCEEWRDNVDQSPIDNIALESRAMDVPAHQNDQINPNDELEKQPSRPDAINSKPEQGNAKVDKLECLPTMTAAKEPENDKDAVVMWKRVANSLSTMQSDKLGDSEVDILNLVIAYMSKIRPNHGSKRALPGNDYITFRNEKYELGINVLPLQQMERLLSGIPNAQAVAFFVLIHLPEEYHALLSCTTIFAEQHTSLWRNHILFEEWSEEESGAFACEFSRLVTGSWTIKSVLQKWHGLLE